MTIFVSIKNLPFIEIDLFAPFFDGLGYLLKIIALNGAGKAQHFLPRYAFGPGSLQSTSKTQHLLLLLDA